MCTCIIPARGGSKRIPRKNIMKFNGRPIISWSILAAKESKIFDRIVVSTDDEEIAAVARDEGAEIPFMRPLALSDDYSGTVPVVAHAIKQLALEPNTAVCCLYATAPMVRASDLIAGRALLGHSGCVVSVTTFPFPIMRALRRDPQGKLEMINPEHLLTRSQDLEEAWHDAGQFYWATAATWLEGTPLLGYGAIGFPLPRNRVQDIDTLEDWERAEALFRTLKN